MRKFMKNKQGRKEKKIFKRENVYPNNLKSNYRINYTKHPAIFFLHRIQKKIKEKLMKNSIMNCEKEKN